MGLKTSGLAAGFLAIVASIGSFPATSQSQDYPNKLVTVTVPTTPGSLATICQFVVESLATRLKQPMITVTRPGADGLIGARAVRAAPADGYNLLCVNASLFNAHLFRSDAGYQVRDFVPIGVIASSPFFLVASSAVPSRTLKELVDYSKANPGKLFSAHWAQ